MRSHIKIQREIDESIAVAKALREARDEAYGEGRFSDQAALHHQALDQDDVTDALIREACNTPETILDALVRASEVISKVERYHLIKRNGLSLELPRINEIDDGKNWERVRDADYYVQCARNAILGLEIPRKPRRSSR